MAEVLEIYETLEDILNGTKGEIRGEFFTVTTTTHPRLLAIGYSRGHTWEESEVIKTTLPTLNGPFLHCFRLIISGELTDAYVYPADGNFSFTPIEVT